MMALDVRFVWRYPGRALTEKRNDRDGSVAEAPIVATNVPFAKPTAGCSSHTQSEPSQAQSFTRMGLEIQSSLRKRKHYFAR
jgi:hypothetical protein